MKKYEVKLQREKRIMSYQSRVKQGECQEKSESPFFFRILSSIVLTHTLSVTRANLNFVLRNTEHD